MQCVVRHLVFGIAAVALPTLALAGPMPVTIPGLEQEQTGGGGYGQRSALSGVVPGDQASMVLRMFDGANNSVSVNMGGEVLVTRGSTFTNLGLNRNGGGQIQGSWDEVVQGNTVYINAIIRSADGSQFMPAGSTVNGQPAFFWNWRFGMLDPVNFMPWVSGVSVTSARIYYSDNSGQSFFAFNNIIGGLNASNWNPGRDPGQMLASIGDGTNFIFLQYQIVVVPAPAGAAAMLGLGAVALRRRRR